MATYSIESRTLASDLANIEADLARSADRADEVLAIGRRLSRVASQIALACERAFLKATEELAA